MSFIVVLFTSFFVFFIIRLLYVLLCIAIEKIFKTTVLEKFNLPISIALLLIYLQALTGAVQGVLNNTEIGSNLEWYLIYTSMGISAILWCYFSWDVKWKSRPKFGKDDSAIAVKKIIVFTLVMLFTFYQGYSQLNRQFSGEEIDLLVTVTNVTIIPGVIALDRVLNQLKSFLEE